MSGIKISNLPSIVTPLISDIFPVVQGGVTYKESGSQLSTLFIPLSGGTMTGPLILNTSIPTTSLQAASKGYVDSVAQGLTIQGACVLATTGALTATYSNGSSGIGATLTNSGAFAALTIDSVLTVIGNRILIKNQAAASQNGIYSVTTVGDNVSVNWVLTRTTDYDTAVQINPGDLIIIESGTVNSKSSWIETATVVTIGTDSITFSQFSASLPISVPNGGTGLTTTTINQILWSPSANVIAGLSTANNGVLVTNSSGVPLILVGPGVTGRILLSNAAAPPSFSTVPYATSPGWTAFTPTLTSAGTVPTFSITQARYQQMGNIVFIEVFLNNSAGGTPGAGANAILMAIPVAAGASATLAVMSCGNFTNGVAYNVLGVQSTAGASTVVLAKGLDGGASSSALQCVDLNDANTRQITFKFFYEV